jgi:hypothetical protein
MDMSKKKAPEKARQAELLKRAKELGAVRVKVTTPLGRSEYKDLDMVGEKDDVEIRLNGDPVIMKGKPGRKGKSPTAVAGAPVNEYVGEQVKLKYHAVQKDDIIRTVQKSPDSPDVLNQVILAIGEEAASLAFERRTAEMEGKETATLSSRRVQALRAMGETWLKRMDQVANKTIDLEGPAFKKVFGYIVESFREAMASIGYREEETDTILAKFSSLITDEWKAEAKNRIQSS